MEGLHDATQGGEGQVAGLTQQIVQLMHQQTQQMQEEAQQMGQMQDWMDQMSRQMQQMQGEAELQRKQTPIEQPASSSGCQQHDGAELVLTPLLEHPAVGGDQAVLCRLLASSRQVAQLAASRCTGRLDASLRLTSMRQIQAAAAWLRRHARLLRSLALRPYVGLLDGTLLSDAVFTALVVGGRQAELLAPGSLSQLRSFSCLGQRSPEPVLLQALLLSCSALTRLELSRCCRSADDRVSGSALAQLTGLRHLQLHGGEWPCDNPGALAGLRHLTCLAAWGVRLPSPDLPRLPATLEHLELSVQGSNVHAVDLGHLTRLTELELLFAHVKEGAKLPPSLVKLTVGRLRSLTPLLRLTALRRLSAGTVPEVAAAALRRLPWLDDVHLWHWGSSGGEAPDPLPMLRAIGGGPIRHWSVERLGSEPAAALQHISRLTGLTSLHWLGIVPRPPGLLHVGFRNDAKVASRQLEALLGSLQQLRELHLQSAEIDWGVGRADGAAAAASSGGCSQAQLMRAALQLPELRAFGCWPGATSDALAELAAATGLTRLCLRDHDVSDAALAPVLAVLTGLERLVLSSSCGLPAAPASCLVEALCGLRRLTALRFDPLFGGGPNALHRLWASLPALVVLGWGEG